MAEQRPEADRERPATRPALDELARTLHSSFLDRWGRHDPAGFEKALDGQRKESPTRRTSVA